MTRAKICGITNLADALHAAEAGADALGFVFAESPRRVTAEEVARIVPELPPFVARVGVFVDETLERIRSIARSCGLTAIQLHGSEPPEYAAELAEWQVLRAIRVRDGGSLGGLDRWRCAGFVLDAYVPGVPGGTGQVVQRDLAREAVEQGHRVILAGGLTPANVAGAIAAVRPYAVDTSSGVEASPGRKDPVKVTEFLRAVRQAPAEMPEGGNA